MRAALYARVSSQSQAEEGWSVDAQMRALRAYAAAQGWTIAGEYMDEGVSAAKESAASRPEFRRMLADVERRRVDVVVVHKIDRFSRNLVVTFQSLARIERADATFVSLTESLDMTTPTGRLMLGVFALFAQFYSDNLGAEVSKGRAERAQAGLSNGNLPFGYESAGDPRLPPKQIDRGALLVAAAFRRYSGGQESAHKIATWMNTQGVKPRTARSATKFTKATIVDMLSNPFYCGKVRYKGEVLPGAHEGIVSEELFEACEEVRKQRAGNPSGTRANVARVYMLRGIARCYRCGSRLWCSADMKTYRRYKETAKLRQVQCTEGRASLSADHVEYQVGALVRRMQLPDDWREQVLAAIGEESMGEDPARRRAELRGRLNRLRELYLEGEVPRSRYETEKARLKAELEALDARLRPVTPIEEAGELLRRYAEVWDNGTEEERAELAHAMFEEVYLDFESGKVRAVKPRALFVELFAVLQRDGMLYGDPDRIRGRVNPLTPWPPGEVHSEIGSAWHMQNE